MEQKMAFKREFSAGGVVYRKFKVILRQAQSRRDNAERSRSIKSQKLKILFLLGKHSGYHKWVLPKGLIEPGERGWQTAIRETEEEMGVRARLLNEKPIHKETYFYYADFKPQSEISNDPACGSGYSSPIDRTFKPDPSAFGPTKSSLRPTQSAGKQISKNKKEDQSTRRVMIYQEQGGGKTKVFKTVTFYLLEYESGNPKEHGWEMEEAGWFDYDEALKIMSFTGEKEAVRKAQKILGSNI